MERKALEKDKGSSEAAAHLYDSLRFPSLNSSEQPCSEQPLSFTDGTGQASEATHFMNASATWVLISTYPLQAHRQTKKKKKKKTKPKPYYLVLSQFKKHEWLQELGTSTASHIPSIPVHSLCNS